MKSYLLLFFLVSLSFLPVSAQDIQQEDIEPKRAYNYFRYNTVAGDSIGCIAAKYNLSAKDIFAHNPSIMPDSLEDVEIIDSIYIDNLVLPGDITLILPKYFEEGNTAMPTDISLTLPKVPLQPLLPKTEKTNHLFVEKYDSYTTHVVKNKETKYGVSKRYNISIQILEQFNPKIIKRFDKGMMLLIPIIKKEMAINKPARPSYDTTLFGLHVVEKQETLFGLSKTYHTTVTSLKKLNPHITGIMKVNDTLIVPLYFDAKVEATQFKAPSYMKKFKEPISFKKSKKEKHFALFLPFMLNKVNFESDDSIKEALTSNKLTQLSLSFYKGVMMAFRKVAAEGFNLILEVFDTQSDPAKTLEAANKASKNKYTGIIGPVFNKNIVGITNSRIRKTPIFLPFSNHIETSDPYLVQTIPSESYIRDQMTEFIQINAPKKHILLIVDEKTEKLIDHFTERFPKVKVINTSDYEYLQKEVVSTLLNKEEENWVILETNKVWLISNTISLLNALTTEFDIQMLTTNSYKAYENKVISKTYLSNLKFLYPSISFENETLSKPFKEAFEKIFNITPDKYALRGFDVAFDMLVRSLSNRKDAIDNLDKIYQDSYIATDFNYVLNSDNPHYRNQHFYLLNYNNLKLNKLDFPSF